MIGFTCFQDVVDHGFDYLGSNVNQSVKRDVIRAAREALRDLTNAYNWSYLYTHGRIITIAFFDSAAQNATLSYTQTGGTYERMATISGTTWPDWIAGAYIRTSFANYKVVERKSATVVTFDPEINPGEDIASGTPFIAYRDTYLLPEDYATQDQALIERNFGGLMFTSAKDWLYANRYDFAQGIPRFYTVTGDNLYPGRMVIRFWPWPQEQWSVDFIYKRRPRPLNLIAYSTGTVAGTGGSNVLTGSGTAFTQAMVGSVIRISATVTPPTSLIMGAPPAFESIITTWISPTSVSIADALDTTYSGSGILVSDILDIEEGAMLNAYFRCVEKHLGMNRTLKDKPSAALQYKASLDEARAADSRSFMGRHEGQHHTAHRRLRDNPYTFDIT